MVETIAPVVYGRRRDYRIAVALHTGAALVTSAIVGAALGLAGLLLGAPWERNGLAFVALVGVIYALRELAGLRLPLFDRKQQVPDWWRTFYSPRVAAALYGAGLGVGFLTYLRHGTFVVVAALAVVTGDPLAGALITAPFGLARGLTALASAHAADEDAAGLVVARLELLGQTRSGAVINGLACLTLASAAAILFLL